MMANKNDNNEEDDPEETFSCNKDMSKDQRDMIKAALKDHIIKLSDKNAIKLDCVKRIADYTKEYLGTFTIIGYDYKGTPVTVTVAQTPQELDSLSTLMNRYIRHGEI